MKFNLTTLFLVTLLSLPIYNEKWACQGKFPLFTVESFALNDPDFDKCQLDKLNVNAYNVASKIRKVMKSLVTSKDNPNTKKLVFTEGVIEGADRIMGSEKGMAIHGFKDNQKLNQLFRGWKIVREINGYKNLMPSFHGFLNVESYYRGLYIDIIYDEQLKDKFDPSFIEKLGFTAEESPLEIRQMVFTNAGAKTLEMLLESPQKAWCLNHRINFGINMMTLISKIHHKGLYLTNLTAPNIHMKLTEIIDGKAPRNSADSNSYYFNGNTYSIRFWDLSDSLLDDEDFNGTNENIGFSPPDSTDDKNWKAWDKYTLAMTLMDMELVSCEMGRLSNINLSIKNQDLSVLSDSSKKFVELAFTELKESVKQRWSSIYGHESILDEISSDNWKSTPPIILHQFMTLAVSEYFRSKFYKEYMDEQYKEHIENFDRNSADKETLMNYFVHGLNIMGMSVQADYVDLLTSFLLIVPSKRPTFTNIINMISDKAGEFLNDHQDNARYINQINALDDEGGKSSIIASLMENDLNPKETSLSSIPLDKANFLTIPAQMNRLLI